MVGVLKEGECAGFVLRPTVWISSCILNNPHTHPCRGSQPTTPHKADVPPPSFLLFTSLPTSRHACHLGISGPSLGAAAASRFTMRHTDWTPVPSVVLEAVVFQISNARTFAAKCPAVQTHASAETRCPGLVPVSGSTVTRVLSTEGGKPRITNRKCINCGRRPVRGKIRRCKNGGKKTHN